MTKIRTILAGLCVAFDQSRRCGNTTAAVLAAQANPKSLVVFDKQETLRHFKREYSGDSAVQLSDGPGQAERQVMCTLDHINCTTLDGLASGRCEGLLKGPIIVDHFALSIVFNEALTEIAEQQRIASEACQALTRAKEAHRRNMVDIESNWRNTVELLQTTVAEQQAKIQMLQQAADDATQVKEAALTAGSNAPLPGSIEDKLNQIPNRI
jgi:hypothetical protein